MTNQERATASKEQIQKFFSAYYSNWRFAKILINEKVLSQRYDFLSDVVDQVSEDQISNDSLIAQELRHGLEFDIIANCLQYTEDLFALLNAGKNVDFFIKEIVTYRTGNVDNLIKTNFSDNQIRELFFIPKVEEEISEDLQNAYDKGLSNLKALICDIQEFYKRYHFFYIQYKHGLTVAMRPFQPYTQELVDSDKEGEMETSLYAMDNLAISKVYGNIYRRGLAVLMPFITPNIEPHVNALQEEDNLFRYVLTPQGTSVNNIKSYAEKVKHCIELFRHNILQRLSGLEHYEIYLPHDLKQIYSFKFSDTIRTPKD